MLVKWLAASEQTYYPKLQLGTIQTLIEMYMFGQNKPKVMLRASEELDRLHTTYFPYVVSM